MAAKTLIVGLSTVVLLVVASRAEARTWRVEKDGSGDFTVIQHAVNGAAPGDTIRVGPGTYEEYSFAWNNGQWDVYSCILASIDNLTILGAGQGNTIVGLPRVGGHPDLDINGIGMALRGRLYVIGLTIVGVDQGVFVDSLDLSVTQCEIHSCTNGIVSWGRERNRVVDCTPTLHKYRLIIPQRG